MCDRVGLLRWAFALVVACNGCSQSVGASRAKSATSERRHELGPVFTDLVDHIDFAIPVVNDSKESVEFEVVSNSCSCTKSKLRKTVLAPGEETVLDGRIALKREVGSKDVRISLKSKSGVSLSFDVHADCYRRLSAPTGTVVSLGLVDPSKTIERELEVQSFSAPGEEAWTIRVDGVSDDRIGAAVVVSKSDTLADGVVRTSTALRVHVHPKAQGTSESATITLGASRRDETLQEELRVFWQTKSVFVVSPPRVLFRVRPGESSENTNRVVTVKRTDGRPFRVLSTSGLNEAFNVTFVSKEQSAAESDIHVSLRQPKPSRNVSSRLCLHTDAEDQPELFIPISAIILPE